MDEACSDKPSNFSCKITDRGLVIGSLKVSSPLLIILLRLNGHSPRS